MADQTEPTNEALIARIAYLTERVRNRPGVLRWRKELTLLEALRTRLAALTERAEKAEADKGFDDETADKILGWLAAALNVSNWDNDAATETWDGDVGSVLGRILVQAGVVSDWDGAIATHAKLKAAEAEIDEMQKSDGWATVTSARDALVKIIGDGYAERSIMPAVGRVERIVSHLKAELARTREALTWAMDEIDELANVACGFAYPQAMTIIGRKSQSDSYFAACTARRAALAKPEPADG